MTENMEFQTQTFELEKQNRIQSSHMWGKHNCSGIAQWYYYSQAKQKKKIYVTEWEIENSYPDGLCVRNMLEIREL